MLKHTCLGLAEFIDGILELLGFFDSTDVLELGLLAGNIGLCWLDVTVYENKIFLQFNDKNNLWLNIIHVAKQ